MAETVVTIEQLVERIGALAKYLPETAGSVMRVEMQAFVRDVQRNRLSGQYLNVVTGTARRSIESRVTVTPDVVRGIGGSALGYVRAHEEGFEGDVQVPPHVRRLRPVATKSKASVRRLKKHIKAGRANYAHVRAHQRHLSLRARRFLRHSAEVAGGTRAADNVAAFPTLARAAQAGLLALAELGRAPTIAEVASRLGKA